jgi:ubiquinone/menaquinone biosynthesis C-methylase UbiE
MTNQAVLRPIALQFPLRRPVVASELTFKELERDGWHERASIYDDFAGPLTRDATVCLLDAVAARPNMRLLDVCCGPGYGAGKAAAGGLNAIGIDIAPAMVEEARRRFPAAEFRVGDAEQLDFPDGYFDAVICPFGLLHLPKPEMAIAEAFRVLRPGARYALTVWCTPDKCKFLGLAMSATTAHADMSVPLPPAPPMFQFGETAFATAALQRAGFDDIAIQDIPIVFRGREPDDAWLWFERLAVRGMMVFRLQTPDVQGRIRSAIVEGARQFFDSNSKTVSIPCTAVMYAATKPG